MSAAQHAARRGRPAAAALSILLLLGAVGCGAPRASTDVGKFVRQGGTPEQRAILRSIGVYRTTKDYRYACSLITPHFLKSRFFGSRSDCEDLSRQAPRALPLSAGVVAAQGSHARVQVREATGTRSVYLMERQGGVWKVDDIVAH